MIRNKFPILKKIVYLDSAAGTLKPKKVVKSMSKFYLKYPINTHSFDSKLATIVSKKIDKTREIVANFINSSKNEIIFTSGTTDSLNKIANMLKKNLNKNDEILLSHFNHSSNIVPWMEIAKEIGAKIIYTNNFEEDINSKTKIVAFAQVNNTIFEKINIENIYKKCQENGSILVNDATQAIIHENVSLKNSHIIAFSGNKLYGPTGIGVLVVQEKLLSQMQPTTFGGGAIAQLGDDFWIPKNTIERFEPGTLNSAGIIGLGEAIIFFNNIKNKSLKKISEYAFDKLSELQDIKIYSKKGDPIIIFNLGIFSPQDVVSYLGHKNIILRAGEHCVKNISKNLKYKLSIRLSLAHYNNFKDINKFINAIKKGGDFLDFI